MTFNWLLKWWIVSRENIKLVKGLDKEIAKKISKELKNNIKKINVSIQGESLRVASKSKNDLQLAIGMMNSFEEKFQIPLQTNNYR